MFVIYIISACIFACIAFKAISLIKSYESFDWPTYKCIYFGLIALLCVLHMNVSMFIITHVSINTLLDWTGIMMSNQMINCILGICIYLVGSSIGFNSNMTFSKMVLSICLYNIGIYFMLKVN